MVWGNAVNSYTTNSLTIGQVWWVHHHRVQVIAPVRREIVNLTDETVTLCHPDALCCNTSKVTHTYKRSSINFISQILKVTL